MVTRRRFILGGALILAEKTSSGTGRVDGVSSPATIELNINNDSWVGSWDQPGERFAAQRVNMEYSSAHQIPTTLKQIEFAMAQHDRAPGDNTGVRWADFSTDMAPTGGYYTANNDALISETDNLPTAYLPWCDGAWHGGIKAVETITGTPTFRHKSNFLYPATQFHAFFTDLHELDIGAGVTTSEYRINFNPACLVNPAAGATWSVYFGGGTWSNFPAAGEFPIVKLIKRNPAFHTVPATSTKPYILKAWQETNKPMPLHMRHAVRIGNWIYWGGGGHHIGTTSTSTRNHEFYRVYAPDLANGIYTYEAITQATPIVTRAGLTQGQCVRFNLLCSDETRRWLIYINIDGVWRYKVPSDDGNDGTWEGPYTFGISDWANTISDGDLARGWRGVIGTHRPDLRQTFFRYNNSRKWNRIKWGD